MSEIILHIATRETWKEAQSRNSYVTESLETEKFIHFSTPAQVVAVADFMYPGQRLVLLCVAPEKLSAELKYEALATSDAYPHLYSPLNLAAVVDVVAFEPRADGTFALPPEIRVGV